MRRLPLLALLALSTCSSHDDPLTDAARAGQEAEVRALLARGADPNAPVGQNEWPPVIHAVHKNQLGTASALIDGGADVNRADRGPTPLMMPRSRRTTTWWRCFSTASDPNRDKTDDEPSITADRARIDDSRGSPDRLDGATLMKMSSGEGHALRGKLREKDVKLSSHS